MANTVRALVSKKKIRFNEDGFDLDLTYITPRIIAMGFPSEGVEGTYRNNMKDVQRFFTTRHAGKFKIYNLCSERKYAPAMFDNRCAHYPFDDHNPSPFETIRSCCEDAHAFLNTDPSNVVAIHCKAGKGRTGMMISSLLMHIGEQKTAADALDWFGRKRTRNNKGVTIPSQIRWVYQYGSYLKQFYIPKQPFDFRGPVVKITQIRLGPAPDFDTGGGCDPYFKINNMAGVKLYDHKKAKGVKIAAWKGTKEPIRDFHVNIPVQGEFRIVFYDQDALSKDDKMFGIWLHSAFVKPSLVFNKNDLDGAVKDKKHKHFKKNFTMEILFTDVTEIKDAEALPASRAVVDDEEDDDDDEDDEDPEFQLPSSEKPKKAAPAKGASTPADDIPPPPPPEEDDIPPPPPEGQ